jgi:hypothetical protein
VNILFSSITVFSASRSSGHAKIKFRHGRDARLGVAAETLLLFAYRKGAEGRQFHRFAPLQAISNFLQDQFDNG